MKLAFSAIAALSCLTSAAAFAQAAPAPPPATAPAAPAAQAAPAAPTLFSLDTPIETLVADPRAKAVLDARAPGLTTTGAYEMIKGFSLRQVQPYSQGRLTDEILAAVAADLALIH
jgi:hypothetical protein